MSTAEQKKRNSVHGTGAAIIGIALAMLSLQLLLASPAFSQTNAPASNAPATAPTTAPRRTSLINPLGAGVTIQTLAGRAARGFIGLSGSFALLMFVYGAFVWVTSAGSPEKITKGKKIFTWAIIGLCVVFGAYAFLNTFLNTLGS